ncbi:TPA: ATP-dependent helicase [Morganella morganii]|nr:ATP-dependent helicase [Morganella morganii]MBT0313828.1 ATP-dependent helicase [Morganella morganii subsp. morganii]ELB1545246.1 ATP-dependent helicase [Morganella morganii]MBT0464155.1 ATP-dependent helicase [Morganella morganii subsp. morganii]MBT0468712.1 ATP-dependent helicase [Morganella morganii subsp. morganii]
MLNLSSSQSQIVHAPFNKAIQVLASAGSGKTRVLTERIRYILQNTKKDGVIALTFTNKAAEEMSVRLEDCIEAEDRAWIATIHSVAQRILEKYGHTVGLPAELHIYDRDKDRMEVFLQSLREDGVNIDEYLNISDSKELKSREKNIKNYMDIFSRIKRELFTESDVTEKYPNNNIWKVFQDYQSSLVNSGGIDYDDILVYAHKILLTHNWIAQIYRSQYKHICIDEAQDLNKAQYEFIKALCGDVIHSVFMVGDPNQMIYGFNGSSKEYLCTYFLEDFTPFQFELKENYRSAKAIIRAANKLKPNSQSELDYALEGSVKIVSADTEEAEAEWITSTVKQLLELKTHPEIEGDISLDKMVVIARNRFVFNKLEDCLKKNNISYSMRKGERQLEPTTIFGRILDYSIRIKLNPKDWVDGKKLCSLLGIIAPTSWSNGVLNILANQTKKLDRENAELYSELMSSINNLDVDEPNIRKFVRLFKEKLTSLISQADAPSEGKSEEIKLSLDELNEFSRAWTLFKRKGLGSSLVAFRNALALGQLTENSLENGLLLSTVHTMKGLEKDIVFLMGMCEGVFPDYRANSIKEIDEERNNAFVAVTRAKRWLYVTYPKQRMMPWKDLKFQQKSRFVREIE